MTIEELKSYRVKKAYCEELEYELRSMSVKDSVSSASTFPYSKHTVVIEGLPKTKSVALKQKELSRVRTQILRIENFISAAPEEMRYILTQKYINGKTNQYIAMKLGFCDESTIRKKIKNYFENSEFSDSNVV